VLERTYTPIERLAIGGMGEIFLARETGFAGFERLVVIKRLLPELAARREHTEMFLDEARIVANLSHPNIVQVHDLGCDEQGFYIAMEYVPGGDLAQLVDRLAARQEVLPRDLAIYVVAELARALAFAHSARDANGEPLAIVHRDVSPHNVLLSRHGDVKLMDFGIAKAANALHRTTTGTLRGKYGYMAPEVLYRGPARPPIDGRADVFAAGVMLWELTLGRRLRESCDELEALEGARSGLVPAPESIDPAYPEQLSAVVRRAVARDPAERLDAPSLCDVLGELLHDTGELRHALGELVVRMFHDDLSAAHGKRTAAPPVRADAPTAVSREPVRSQRAKRRLRWRPVLGLALVLVLVIVVGVATVLRSGGGANEPVSAAWRAAAHDEHEKARAILDAEYDAGRGRDPESLALRVIVDFWLGSSQLGQSVERARAGALDPAHRALVEALLLVHTGRSSEAIALLEREVREAPEAPALRYALGEALWHSSRPDEGAAALRRAFELDPRWTFALTHVVDRELAAGNAATVSAFARRIDESDPVGAVLLETAAAITRGDVASARVATDIAILRFPHEATLWTRRAELCALAGDLAEGERSARRAFELSPVDDRDSAAFAQLVEFHLYRGDLGGFFDALGAKVTNTRVIVETLWKSAVVVTPPAPLRPDRQHAGPLAPRMLSPPLWAATIVLAADRDGVDARSYWADYPQADVRAYGEALAAERAGDLPAAAAGYERALAAPASGELRMLLAYHLARARHRAGDLAGARAACAEVLRPRVYRPYRAVLLPECTAWTTQASDGGLTAPRIVVEPPG
jgi:tetratricopeptide (TPR) repeat protein